MQGKSCRPAARSETAFLKPSRSPCAPARGATFRLPSPQRDSRTEGKHPKPRASAPSPILQYGRPEVTTRAPSTTADFTRVLSRTPPRLAVDRHARRNRDAEIVSDFPRCSTAGTCATEVCSSSSTRLQLRELDHHRDHHSTLTELDGPWHLLMWMPCQITCLIADSESQSGLGS